ncbi:MAG: hypothetical protein ACKPHU_19090, partial [Planctomycetaceae bacterium]
SPSLSTEQKSSFARRLSHLAASSSRKQITSQNRSLLKTPAGCVSNRLPNDPFPESTLFSD